MKCCEINAGMLREPVTFQRMTRTSDGAGGQTQSWATVSGAPTRAYVRVASGREQYSHDRVEAVVKLKLTTRYTTAITESDRVLIRGKAHNIKLLNNLEFRNQWLEIGVDGGVAS
jgi:SPP1 family predicted phage head-tail adaptor